MRDNANFLESVDVGAGLVLLGEPRKSRGPLSSPPLPPPRPKFSAEPDIAVAAAVVVIASVIVGDMLYLQSVVVDGVDAVGVGAGSCRRNCVVVLLLELDIFVETLVAVQWKLKPG